MHGYAGSDMKNTNIRIISDGTALDTKVFGSDGVEIKGCITKIEWSIDGDVRAGVATITFLGVDLDVIGEMQDG